MYKFSVPMPYNNESINKLVSINNEVEKSKITSLYFSLPSTNELFTGFEQTRNQLLDKKDFSFWKDLVSFSIDKGFEIIYCLNMPRPLAIENPKFPNQIERLHKLLGEFEKTGLNKLRVASPKLMSYLHKYFPKFDIYGSTASDYKLIQEFQFLKQVHPYIKQIVPSHNVNKNFMLLKNIQKLGFEVEVMVNEGCLQGCSNRFEHECTYTDNNIELHTKEKLFQEVYCKNICSKIENRNPILYLTKGNHIYPWELEEYEKIGITNFKLNGRDGIKDNITQNKFIDIIELYLKGIDDLKIIENIPIINFIQNSISKLYLQNLKIKDIKQHLPQIKHFAKYGHLCSSICEYKCRYCLKCAGKIQGIFNKIKKEEEIKNISICYCKN